MLRHVQLFATPQTIAGQAPRSMGFPKPEYWSRLPFLTPRHFPKPGIKLESPVSPALAGGCFNNESLRKPTYTHTHTHTHTYMYIYIERERERLLFHKERN